MKKGVVERYRDYLPVTDQTPLCALGEGDTPLVKSRKIGDKAGCSELYFKLEGCNPTGSFKDRGMVVAVAKAVEAGGESIACASTGTDFTLASPSEHRVPTTVWEEAKRRASIKESQLRWVEKPQEAVRDADIVYTDVWISMGQESDHADRLGEFSGYQVNEELMRPPIVARKYPRACWTIPVRWSSTRPRTASTPKRPSSPTCFRDSGGYPALLKTY